MNYFVIIFVFLSQIAAAQGDYLIRQGKLFDGFFTREKVDVLIKDGIIQSIGTLKSTDLQGATVISGEGRTIIPGLVNCHVHAWLPYHLKNAMQSGVFAVLDMHTSIHPDSLDKYQLEDGYARFYSTGYAATVKEGHGTQYGFRVSTIGENRTPSQFVRESAARGSDYIKIIYEPQRPTLSVKQVTEIIAASKTEGLLTIAHISRIGNARDLINTGLDGFAHMWKDAPASQLFLDSIANQEIFIVPTISVMEGVIKYYRENDIPVPFSDLATLKLEVKRLQDAGIALLAGTDPPNVGLDYGSSLHNELKLFVEGGLTPIQALKAATSTPNKVFNLGEIGVIEVGTSANFTLIDGDPLERIEEISQIQSIWAGGKKIK